MIHTARSLLLAAGAVLLCCCQRRENTVMRVELDIFSGRPNPAFELSAGEAGHLQSLLDGLSEASPPPAEEDGLGYRGLTVTPAGGVPIRLSGGLVAIGGGPEKRWYRDRDSAVEKWLLERAAEHGHSELVLPLLRAR